MQVLQPNHVVGVRLQIGGEAVLGAAHPHLFVQFRFDVGDGILKVSVTSAEDQAVIHTLGRQLDDEGGDPHIHAFLHLAAAFRSTVKTGDVQVLSR